MSLSVFPNLADDSDVVEQFSMKLFNPASVATFSLSIQNQTVADFSELASPEEIPPPVFNGKYEGKPFTATVGINITMPVDELTGPVGTATLNDFYLLDYTVDCAGYSAKKSGEFIEVSGASFNVFPDQVYQFLMPDLSVKQLDPNTTEDFISVVKWVPPSTKYRVVSHKFSVLINYSETTTGSVNRSAILTLVMPQAIRWEYSSGVNGFRQVLAKSRRA